MRNLLKPRIIFENDRLIAAAGTQTIAEGYVAIPHAAFTELENRVRDHVDEEYRWLRFARGPKNAHAIQILGHVGVLRTSDGTQLEVLPKIGKQTSVDDSRLALVEMIKALPGCRWHETQSANIQAHKMPLFEVFIREFLLATRNVVRQGIRNDYHPRQDNLMALRGRILHARNITENLVRPDRFFTEHDVYSANRAENRLLHTALCKVLGWSRLSINQQFARELCFIFHDIPLSTDFEIDFKRIRSDRGLSHYKHALDWAILILRGYSPLINVGKSEAPSLMFPMAKLFESYVEKTLRKRLAPGFTLKSQERSEYFVEHQKQNWMQLKPDLIIEQGSNNVCVLDTKWKLLDTSKSNSKDKYNISQSDFYQLYAYAHYYIDANGPLILIYPQTESFDKPLMFDFNKPGNGCLTIWAIPFKLPTVNNREGELVIIKYNADAAKSSTCFCLNKFPLNIIFSCK